MEITQNKVSKCIQNLNFTFPYSVDDWCENLYLENYHCHKAFSNCPTRADSPTSIEDYTKRVKELNGKCLYSLEHGFQGSWMGVYDVAEQNHLKYRHSSEVYWVKDRHEDDATNCHMCIIAKNNSGKEDLNYILSIANEDGYYYKPRIDLGLLLSVDPDNFIVTSACVAGWKYEDAESIWLKIWKHFGNNFFLEVQNHNTEPQKNLNKRILRMSKKYGIQIICGLDSHYIHPEDSVMRDQLLEYKHINYADEEGWYLDYPDTEEVIRRFEVQGVLSEEEILTAILNTNVFVDECKDIELNRKFKIPTIYPNLSKEERIIQYKKELNNAYKKEKMKSKEKAEGIRWEAQQIIESDTVDYMLTSQAILKLGVEKYGGVLTTTSRGSAASFCSNKLLGFTTMDRFNAEVPIYPERFLTKDRVLAGQMPDIDCNIASQEPFVKAARELLGEHGCYPLMAVEVLKEKNAWKLYASNHDIDNDTANVISKAIDEYNLALKHADDDEKDMIDIHSYIPDEYYDIYMQSRHYQGIVTNLKVHACGYLILNKDIRREIGLVSAISESTGVRTLVACVEGKYLDSFGFVKTDLLVVDSVSLTYELFQSIGEKVPSFDELKERVKGDKPTWDIYAKGITCCVNQCEQPKTAQKAKRYKAQSIGELAGFIAGIRPGFASLINTYIDRKEYSTGEPEIDKLLEESSHFLIFQESLMKVLSFLGLPMQDTYSVIKSISKKKLKGEKKRHLMEQLRDEWLKHFGNLNNFNKVWKVIEDSAAYAFNAPHALAMAGDSLYQAWFKAHHTVKFYEVAITHYQNKGNKDKIDSLIKEASQYYGFKLGGFKFRADHRRINIDEQTKVIYPNLSSLKGFGENIAIDLFKIGQREYKDFIEVIKTIREETVVNKTQLDILIKLDFFSEFGEPNELLTQVQIFNAIYGKKTAKKNEGMVFIGDYSMSQERFNETVVKLDEYKETAKQIKGFDSVSFIKSICDLTTMPTTSVKERIQYSDELLGYVNVVDPHASKRLYYVLDIKGKKLKTIELYEVYSGKKRTVKMWESQFNRAPFEQKNFLMIRKLDKKNKRQPSEQINPKTGKQIWVDVPNEFEFWLEGYEVEQ